MRDGGHALFQISTGFLIIGADSAAHGRRVGDNVPGLSRVEGADGQDCLVRRGQLPCVYLLESDENMRRRRQGVNAVLGCGAVTTLAMHPDGEIVRRRGADAGGGDHHRPGRKRHSRRNVNHQGCVGSGIFQHAGGNHVLAALENFLCGLEHELDRTAQFRFVGFQDFRRAQQHGGVHIMAAGMHPPVFAGEIHVGFLGNGQGVHIRPKQQNFPSGLANGCNKSRFSTLMDGITHLRKCRFYIRLRFRQVKSGFRVGVKPQTMGFDLLLKRFGFA